VTMVDLADPGVLGPQVGEYRAPRTQRPLRVVYVWDADYPWDVRTEKICATLTSAGHDVHIVARNRAWRPTEERLPEGTVHRMTPWRWLGRRLDAALGFPAFFSPRWYALLDRTVRQVRPHVLIGRDIPLAPTTIWVGRRHGVPVVLDVAEHYPAMIQVIYETGRQRPLDYLVRNPAAVRAVERYAVRRAGLNLVVVDEMVDRLAAMGVPRDRIDVVSNTTPRSRAEPEPPRRDKAPGAPIELVYLGNLEVARGIGELVDAVALLRDEGLPVRARIVGKGRDAELFQAQARDRGLTAAQIEFLGYVDRDTALATVEGADIGVLPHHYNDSWNATMPNKLFDYMAVGLPVVTSHAKPCARIIRETGAGEVFEAGDARSLADAIRRLASPSARAACGEAGRRAVLGRYNWETETAVLVRSIERVASTAIPLR
jgi:glycosyltransferase involved in cell wall biosynthesis